MKNILAIIGTLVIIEKIFEAGRFYENCKRRDGRDNNQ